MSRVWSFLDGLNHSLARHGRGGIVPWICDMYDVSLGVPREVIRRERSSRKAARRSS